MTYHLVSELLDEKFKAIQDLSWFPWVGHNYLNLPEANRVLVVGESHYSNDGTAETIAKRKNWPEYTRACINECPVNLEWRNPTLENIKKVLLGSAHGSVKNSKLWKNLSYYNFVQRPMEYSGRNKERPTDKDCVTGWQVFLELACLLKPKYCLFLGVGASKSYNAIVPNEVGSNTKIEYGSKVGSVYPRLASLVLCNSEIQLSFIKHPSKYFSWRKWHEFLSRGDKSIISATQKNL